jgi:hypothetical protein
MAAAPLCQLTGCPLHTGYASQRHCAGGFFLPGEEWTGGPEFGSPELHCCECGKAEDDSKACVDTPGWQNNFAATCARPARLSTSNYPPLSQPVVAPPPPCFPSPHLR